MQKLSTLIVTLSLAGGLHAAVKLPALISDHMVLQQGVPVRIWGTRRPGRIRACGLPGTERLVYGGHERQVDRLARPLSPLVLWK